MEVCYRGLRLCSVTGGSRAERALCHSPHASRRWGVTLTSAIPGFQMDFPETQGVTLTLLCFEKLLKGSWPKVQSQQ